MDINLESKYLEELGKGDHKAFDMLYIQYSPRLKHFLTGFIKNRDEASDMTQDIFYKIWTNRETISKVDSFKAYRCSLTLLSRRCRLNAGTSLL